MISLERALILMATNPGGLILAGIQDVFKLAYIWIMFCIISAALTFPQPLNWTLDGVQAFARYLAENRTRGALVRWAKGVAWVLVVMLFLSEVV